MTVCCFYLTYNWLISYLESPHEPFKGDLVCMTKPIHFFPLYHYVGLYLIKLLSSIDYRLSLLMVVSC